MSELNVAVSPTGFVGTDRESSIHDPIEKNKGYAEVIADETLLKNDNEQDGPLTPNEVSETVEEMNSFLQNIQRNLSFSVDEQLGESVILVKDAESDEVIRQIPSEELVVLRKKMDDVVGILFDTKV